MPTKKSYNRTDLGNAEFFKRFVNGNLIYNYRNQIWYEWNGAKWKACMNGKEIQWAKRAVRGMLAYAATMQNAKKRKQYAVWAMSSESERRIMSMMKLARSEPGIADSGEEWDTDPFILGCPSGVLDLRTGNLMQPDKSIKLVSSIAIDPDDSATCPQWEQFLQEIYLGDYELIGFIKRLLGYSLTGSIKEQCVFCLYGQGANGKSTLTDTVLSLFGQYGYAMPFSTIEYNNRPTISNDLAQLYGRRFVIASETQEGVRLNEGRLKSITGGDVVTARFMYKDLFSYKPQAKFILAFNHKPIITDDSEGAWRRIHLIQHKRVFKKHERDGDLPEKLLSERAGILNWMIEGCLEWQRDGLKVPQSVLDGTTEYREEMNPLQSFIDDDCILGSYQVRVTDLWEAYLYWADANREKFKLSKRQFNNRLESMNLERRSIKNKKGQVEKCWTGIGLAQNPAIGTGMNIQVIN